ncbi:MAG TPA: hypothetical protein VE646_05245 [Actinomycetota bacterium]|jgi:hypothetical protein|nr:hypothetical protein [Actinomycetota bacterium]
MRLSWRDGLATLLVGAGAILYALWLADAEVAGFSGVRPLAGLVLGLGLAASVTAVVYGVGAGLLRASKVYLTVASVIGLTALVAGTVALVGASETMLAALVASTVALWAISTARHGLIAEHAGGRVAPTAAGGVGARAPRGAHG